MMTATIEDIPAEATLMQAAEKMKELRENDRMARMITINRNRHDAPFEFGDLVAAIQARLAQ